ncbi:hypothetical protein ACIQ6Y_00600 [Streptomyces sp. NPDC096205]|uniref:hypothetical protein n=1 Tax=Streptomyces sp. NPDC096205 TaxID=3366081 RepID=UPI00380FF8DD
MADTASATRATRTETLRLARPSATALVAGVFVLVQLLLVPPRMGLGWDEIVYVSQVGDHAPAAFFSAPRARGVTLLAAPVASWTSSTTLLRIYFTLLAALGLYLALRAWRGLFPERVLAAAGALFASLWVTVFYGPQAMPNYWVAIGALVCAGCVLRVRAGQGDRAALWGVAGSAALMALMRPTDAVWVTLPLLVLVLAVRHRRLLAALLGGLAAGAAEWVIEAYVSYGGLTERLDEASRIQGGLGWNIAIGDQLRSLTGRALCRPCTGDLPNPVIVLWWFTLPVLAGLGLWLAVRARRTERTLVPVACALTAGIPYLFLIGYAAPRFLLPFYALLAIPVADALWHLVRRPGGAWRPVAATLVAAALAGHLAVQGAVLHSVVGRTVDARGDWARTADELHRLGVQPPCLITGFESIPLGYYTGCASGNTIGHNANTTKAAILEESRRHPVATIARTGSTPPRYARSWPRHGFAGFDLYVAPTAQEGGDG